MYPNLRLWLMVGSLALPPVSALAIASAHLTLDLPADRDFIARKVLNNNRTPRVYQLTLYAIQQPADHEQRLPAVDGELLYSPKTLVLRPGESDIFRFYYRGPADNKERYYRILINEIPTRQSSATGKPGSRISMEPEVILETLFVVRPRKINFSYQWQPGIGRLINNGNTYFKLLVKPDCQSNEQQEQAWYLLPGRQVTSQILARAASSYLVYSGRFIPLRQNCAGE
ncbi:hypothetical protein HA49_00780 [Tatumella morbirosei]|uniref:Pili assembly chaperone N-terminal domain-containing protein n=1 Tax=Tatumella morbirosei TaxID=642227 RepID=A0A095V144_9GAMM|nr:hypothetical protein HA49_00780 [Tatumella morbirosei]